MEVNSEGENPKAAIKVAGNSGGEGPSKPKRQMKTPFQLETLEKAYALETYPSDAMRAELSEKLGLTDRQLQMWFCHRRLKDKKEPPAKKPRKETSNRETFKEELPPVAQDGVDDYGSGSGSGSSPFTDPRKASLDDAPMRRYFDSPQSITELRAITCVEAQLGEPLREDGPILGVEFDPLPPGAFGTPIVPIDQQKRISYPYEAKVYERLETKPTKSSSRTLHEYQFLQDQPSLPPDVYSRSPFKDHTFEPLRGRASPYIHGDDSAVRANGMPAHSMRVRQQEESSFIPREFWRENLLNIQANIALETSPLFPESQMMNSDLDLRLDRKRKTDEARIAREVEGHEMRMRKELEKQDIIRRKNEERMKKEMERLDRERKKEEERMLRERHKEEEKLQREQKREIERREKFLQKEYIRAEKKRQKEEIRREKEAEKRKAAMEKATARRIAKEALDLIEDEHLELMELAASKKGVLSIAHLDFDALQNLDHFRDSLTVFPPESVRLKKPIAIEPWADSEDNIGKLLMAWRFFICFADVLGLWPFTLEEFMQSLHDYDSRLLAEIHISLIKLIIKDIEDVARTPTGGLGTNQYSAVNPEGGHPKIVEGAYVWGFDIRNWQRFLNPLTWTEILRQLALAAGFGPRLKKRTSTWNFVGGDDGKSCEDTISTLRNGSAAENAFALMREKGLLVPRRSRHRLTPGTVKFAAFHVLSLEGDKGLTVIELAEKIQKSGLRDLTTSKTPEASISVALTRDQKLFERIAPSTYCVRAAFRKDPADAEAILSSARKKIRMFESGFAAEDADDAERDEESDGEDDDPEVDDLANTPLSVSKAIVSEGSAKSKEVACMDPEDMEIDESNEGESWIQGLTEGDYSHLCVEERLNALVRLVCIANEGNSLRAVLEDRLEAANSLKKQMWNEAQLDRSRLKEEITMKLDPKAESASPLVDMNKEASPVTERATCEAPDSGSSQFTSKRSRSQLKAYIGHSAEEVYCHRSLPLGQDRRRNRYWQFVASASRNDPCCGRVFVELHDGKWRVIDNVDGFDSLLGALDSRGVRESHLRLMLRKIEANFKDSVKRLATLENSEVPGGSVCSTSGCDSSPSSSLLVQLGRNEDERMAAFDRFMDLQRWMWKETLNSRLPFMKHVKKRVLQTCDTCMDAWPSDSYHCSSCHQAARSASEHKSCGGRNAGPTGTRGIGLLKALLSLIEASVPAEALEDWTQGERIAWGEKVSAAASVEDVYEALTVFESGVKREYLAANYETTRELLEMISGEGTCTVLPWVPRTSGGVSLKAYELAGSVMGSPEEAEEKPLKVYMKVASAENKGGKKGWKAAVKGKKRTVRKRRGYGRSDDVEMGDSADDGERNNGWMRGTDDEENAGEERNDSESSDGNENENENDNENENENEDASDSAVSDDSSS